MPWSDEKAEGIIATLLRSGVLASAAVVCIGGIWYLVQHGSEVPDYHVFRGQPPELRSVSGVLRGLAAGNDQALIQLGLLLLIATPVARVAFAAAVFALQRDRTYVVISLAVLAVLLFGLAG